MLFVVNKSMENVTGLPVAYTSGNHISFSKQCYLFIFEKEVQATRRKEITTFQEAKERALSKYIRPSI